jgi:prepilin-type N-terminal cleavage/methylation domain-containing protein
MKLRRFSLLSKGQRGFTLLELIIAVAITGAIAGGITMSIFQTFDYDARGKARMIAVKQVENVVHHMIRDVQMAQEVQTAYPDPDGDGFPLTLEWIEWDNTENEVVYDKASGELIRSHSVDGGTAQDTVVAQYINMDAADTNCVFDDDEWRFTFKVTATVSGYPEEISETRDVEITPRSS